MKIVDLSRFAKRTISFALLLTLFTAYSMVTLATSTKPVGELIVMGASSDRASVTVNGEPATSGRTIFASSTIITPDGVSAVLNMGKAGKIELSPNTTFVIDGDGNVIGGSLTAGNVTVLNSAEPIGITTISGETVSLNTGETVSSNSTAATPQTAKKAGTVVLPILGAVSIWALIAVASVATVATVAVVASNTGDDNGVGSNISPVR